MFLFLFIPIQSGFIIVVFVVVAVFLFVLQITNIINWRNHSAACLARLKVLKNSTSIIAINNMLSKHWRICIDFQLECPEGPADSKRLRLYVSESVIKFANDFVLQFEFKFKF